MANDYAVIGDVQQMLPDILAANAFNTTYNAFLTKLITRASRKFDTLTLRQPGAYAVSGNTAQYFDGGSAYDFQAGSLTYKLLNIREIAAAPTLVEVSFSGRSSDFVTFASSDYFMYPYNALVQGDPYWGIVADFVNGSQYYWGWYPRCVRITGPWGYSTTVPDDVQQAVLIQVMRWFKRGQQKYEDLAVMTDPNQVIYHKYDDDFVDTTEKYRRVSVG